MIKVHESVDALVTAGTEPIVRVAENAVRQRGRFVIALSGGHSPEPLYRRLAQAEYRERIAWDKTVVLWSDERYVPLSDERSNAGMAKQLLLDHVPVREPNVLPMYHDNLSAEEAADAYQAHIRRLVAEDPPQIDLTLLGCGEDGHTASLFPGSSLLQEDQRLIAAVPGSETKVTRITMTPLLLTASREVMFIVYGAQKAEAVHRVLQPHDSSTPPIPARMISLAARSVYWLLDSAAASKLASG